MDGSTLLSLSGDRELVSAERARELLAPYDSILSDVTPPSFTHISLRNKSYTLEAAQVLASFFQRLQQLDALKNLTHVDFADIIAGRPEDEALQVLKQLCDALASCKQLEHIDLSDNALGEKGVRACFGLIQEQAHLREMYFCNNGISAAAAEVIVDEVLLFRGTETPTKLQLFHFYNNMSGDGGAKALAKLLPLSPELRDLRFSATRAQREGSLAFAKALAGLNYLEKLDLSDNTFKEEGGVAIAKAVEDMRDLTLLNLRDASVEDGGMDAIATALADTCSNLMSLDVSGNDLTPDGMTSVALVIQNCVGLRVLQAEENEVESKGARTLASAIKTSSPNLDKLVLNVNEIGTSGAVAIVDAILQKPNFTSLEIDGNAISSNGISSIMYKLEKADKSDVLGSLEDNDEDGEESEEDIESVSEDMETASLSAISTTVLPGSSPMDDLGSMLEKNLSLVSEPISGSFSFVNSEREVVDQGRARALLAEAAVDLDATSRLHFDSVSLRGKSYTEDGAQVIAKHLLSRLSGLKVADFADVIAGRAEAEALRVLETLCAPLHGQELDEIDLSDNALGEKGVRACFQLLIPQPNLRRLLFCNNGISAAAAQVIADEVIIQNKAPLEEFHFYNNMSGADGCLAIANVLHTTPELRFLRFASARAGEEASAEMARSIGKHLRRLQSLDLSDCSFGGQGAAFLADALHHQKNLMTLKLRDAGLGIEGVKLLVDALENADIQLVHLDLSGNELEDEGLEVVTTFVKKQLRMETLALDENEVTSDGLSAFAEALRCSSLSTLTSLSFIGNEITKDGAVALVSQVCLKCPKLTLLELDANQISASGVDEMCGMLEERGRREILGSLDENEDDE